MPKQLKRSLTISEEIERLKNVHNLTIEDNAMAEKILSRVNYYTLRGYGEYGKLFDEEASKAFGDYKFAPGITIEHLYNLYLFDCELRSKILKLIGYIEKNVKITISLSITNYEVLLDGVKSRLGPDGYLKRETYSSNKQFKNMNWMFSKMIDDLLTKESYKHEDIVKHHKDTYGSQFPLWVIIEYLEIGKVHKLFKSLTQHIKDRILNCYNLTNDDFTNYLGILWCARNKCAHFNRLYGNNIFYFVVKNNCGLISKGMFHPIYEVLQIIKYFLLQIGMSKQWSDFVQEFNELLINYPEVKAECLGFDKDKNPKL